MFLCFKAKTNTNCSFPVRPQLHLSWSLLPSPLQPPAAAWATYEHFMTVFHYSTGAHSGEGHPLLEAIQMGLARLKATRRLLRTVPSVWLVRGWEDSVILSHLHCLLPGVLGTSQKRGTWLNASIICHSNFEGSESNWASFHRCNNKTHSIICICTFEP